MQLSSGVNKEKKVKRDKSDAWAYPCRTPQGLRSNLTCRLVTRTCTKQKYINVQGVLQTNVLHSAKLSAGRTAQPRRSLVARTTRYDRPTQPRRIARPPQAKRTHGFRGFRCVMSRPRAAAWSAACRRGAAARPVSSRCSAVHLGRSLYYVLHYRACTP